MGRAYSMDLRERVVAAVAQEGLSRRQAAARFGVSDSTAINSGPSGSQPPAASRLARSAVTSRRRSPARIATGWSRWRPQAALLAFVAATLLASEQPTASSFIEP